MTRILHVVSNVAHYADRAWGTGRSGDDVRLHMQPIGTGISSTVPKRIRARIVLAARVATRTAVSALRKF
ncbi:hypothetical protein [uncultured Paracoccus sp.]|uniref:hypothetical protein n=1 Tax=uncultured Paracoccus sp. TaxID=189685 RepID=UPI0025EA3346|nr:hypothetical protein [uncultured Paracoccus sp.]